MTPYGDSFNFRSIEVEVLKMNESRSPKIGFIGFGELGGALASGLKNQGIAEIKAFDKELGCGSRAENLIRSRAEAAGVTLVDTGKALAGGVDVVFSTVTPVEAINAANATAPNLGKNQIYADLNSCAPGYKQEADKTIRKSGARYVDVGVVGGAAQGLKVPCLACGEAAALLKQMFDPFGMNIRVIDAEIGTAALLKMLRSVVMKGIEGLIMEMFITAQEYGVGDEALDAVAITFDQGNFKNLAGRLMTTHALHAGRRLGEVEMVAETIKAAGFSPFITEGVKNFFAHTAGLDLPAHFKGKMPKDYREVAETIMERSRGG
jgi:3-hydroxyisobutyrate dehydrogenase-like beta-hydroxyacid dehydrogenase